MAKKSEYQQIVSKKASRYAAAARLSAAFEARGAEVAIIPDDSNRAIDILGELKSGHKFSVMLESIPHLNTFSVDWFGSVPYPVQIKLKGWVQSINEFHNCKATGEFDTFDELEYAVCNVIDLLLRDHENRISSGNGESHHPA